MNSKICTEIGDLIMGKSILTDGLMHGKSGISIFYYHLAKKTSDKRCLKYADLLIDDIFRRKIMQDDFVNGIAGIGWSMEYLIQNNFCTGNPNDILKDTDTRIFKIINEQSNIGFGLKNGLVGYLQYLIIRLKNKRIDRNPKIRINIELFKQVINEIDKTVSSHFINITRDIRFNLLEDIYVLITSLCYSLNLNIYNDKIINMFREWEPYFTSYIPGLHINRLYLATILSEINRIFQSSKIRKQIEMILYSLDSSSLVSEVDMRIINNLKFGYLGEILVLDKSIRIFNPSYPNYEQLVSVKREILDLCNNKLTKCLKETISENKETEDFHYGIAEGWAGVGLLLLLYPDIFENKYEDCSLIY
jgi:hypothetical protein